MAAPQSPGGGSLRRVAAGAVAGAAAVRFVPAIHNAVKSAVASITGSAPEGLQCLAVGAVVGGVSAHLYARFVSRPPGPGLPSITPPQPKRAQTLPEQLETEHVRTSMMREASDARDESLGGGVYQPEKRESDRYVNSFFDPNTPQAPAYGQQSSGQLPWPLSDGPSALPSMDCETDADCFGLSIQEMSGGLPGAGAGMESLFPEAAPQSPAFPQQQQQQLNPMQQAMMQQAAMYELQQQQAAWEAQQMFLQQQQQQQQQQAAAMGMQQQLTPQQMAILAAQQQMLGAQASPTLAPQAMAQQAAASPPPADTNYPKMIYHVFLQSGRNRLRLQDIIEGLSVLYPWTNTYQGDEVKKFRQRIRFHLTSKRCFDHKDRLPGESGRGGFWVVVPEYEADLTT